MSLLFAPCESASAGQRALQWVRVLAVSGLVAGSVAVCGRGAETSPIGAATKGNVRAVSVGLTAADATLLEELERASFRFFLEQADPGTGLVADRARTNGGPFDAKASIAATGFALSGWVIATERGWVDRSAATAQVRHMLRFLATEAPRQHGFFYHFMEPATGERAWNCEVSPIDTALCLAGAIAAREYFADDEITARVDQLYAEIDWNWMRPGGDLLALGWDDERGFTRHRWTEYSEHMVMSLLAMGSPTHPVGADYWQHWRRQPSITYAGWHFLAGPPLFMHQFSHAYVDFRGLRDAYADYFANSRLATLAQRQFCIDLAGEFPGWGANTWGLTASDTADGYRAYGGPPRTGGQPGLTGTLVPCAAAGSLPFAPAETLAVLRHLRTAYGDRIWGRYGFADAFNPVTGWVGPDVIGIDVGITLVQAENLRTGLIQRLVEQAPEMRRAKAQAGFVRNARTVTATDAARLRSVAEAVWASLALAEQPEAGPGDPGAAVGAILSARGLGLVAEAAATSQVLNAVISETGLLTPDARSGWAAALVAARQALPGLRDRIDARLETLRGELAADPLPETIGSAERLGLFMGIVLGAREAGDWAKPARQAMAVGDVRVLTPIDAAAQGAPGLWLDESGIITGASAAQLAYALTIDEARRAPDVAASGEAALRLTYLPAAAEDVIAGLAAVKDWARQPRPMRQRLLIAIGNLIGEGSVRRWFETDSMVQAGKARIPGFGESAFGPNTSLTQRRELSGEPMPPAREALAVTADQAEADWDWQTVAGDAFLDGGTGTTAGDPALSLCFAFAWDATGLRFRADVVDVPVGYTAPTGRGRVVELFVDPQGDGFDWSAGVDRKFDFFADGKVREAMTEVAVSAAISSTITGYRVDARIPWSALGLDPDRAREIRLSAAVFAGGPFDSSPACKLNWSYAPTEDGPVRLGRVKLVR